MTERLSVRLPLFLVMALLALGFVSAVRADGEVGLVVQEGSEVKTYCIAFSGDGLTGQELLTKAGISIDAYGGGSGLAVCALGNTGCKDSGSFTSCFCQCQGGDCTYWAFFTRQFGKNWVYSSLAFNLLKAKDGDVHGWKWGKGAANSAPAPQDITFSQICGHDPRGGMAPTVAIPATATSQAPTASVSTAAASTTTTAAPQASSTGAPTGAKEAPTVTVSIAGTATNAAATASPTAVPLTPATGDANDEGSSSSYLAFGAIAGVLVAAIGGGLIWRRRNGR